MEKIYKPGQKCPKSGQYGIRGPRGGDLGSEVTSTKGEPFPPTKKPGQTYKLIYPTIHKNNKK